MLLSLWESQTLCQQSKHEHTESSSEGDGTLEDLIKQTNKTLPGPFLLTPATLGKALVTLHPWLEHPNCFLCL